MFECLENATNLQKCFETSTIGDEIYQK